MVSKKTLMRDIITESLSEEHVNIIEKLKKPQYDEDIADKLKIKATIVRTLLNELHEKSLVEYERSKNKKTGWYTYLWKRREDRVDDYLRNFLTNKLQTLNDALDLERQVMIFSCACTQVPFEIAMDSKFVCPNCDEKFTKSNSADNIDSIVNEIAEVSSVLEQV